MSISLLSHTGKGSPNPVTTVGIDTTGATLLVALVSDGQDSSGFAVTDSNSNTWHSLTLFTAPGSQGRCQIWYSYDKSGSPLSVGAGHTASCPGGFPVLSFSAWSGTDTTLTSPFDVQNGNTSALITNTVGSVTPARAGSLIISGIGGYVATSNAIDSSFISLDNVPFAGGNNYDGASAYLIQGAISAVNPTWTLSGANPSGAGIAVFKAAVVASNPHNLLLLGVG